MWVLPEDDTRFVDDKRRTASIHERLVVAVDADVSVANHVFPHCEAYRVRAVIVGRSRQMLAVDVIERLEADELVEHICRACEFFGQGFGCLGTHLSDKTV